MKRIVLALAIGLLSSSPYADESLDKGIIFKMMKTYTSLVACMTSFENDPENGRPTIIKDIHTVF